jgi:hypothetical protein
MPDYQHRTGADIMNKQAQAIAAKAKLYTDDNRYKDEDLHQRAIDYVAEFYEISKDTAVRLFPDEVHAAVNLFEFDDNDKPPAKWKNEFMNTDAKLSVTENASKFLNDINLPIVENAAVFVKPPEPVGFWVIGGSYQVPVRVKATDEQIKNTEELLGWEWKDAFKYGIKVRLSDTNWVYYTDAATGEPLFFDTRKKAESVANDIRKESKEGSVIVVEYT